MVLLDVSLLVGGALLVILGGLGIVEAGIGFARRLGVSPLVIGLTVVALGTSAPEMGVGVVAALRGAPEVALGDIVGSNLATVMVALGLAATMRPIAVERVTLRRDIPLVLAAGLVVLALAWDGMLRREEGLILLGGAAVYLFRLYRHGERGWLPAVDEIRVIDRWPVAVQVVVAVVAVGALALGGWMMVEGTLGFATAVGVTSRVVALSLVALGTAAPEIATVLAAVHRGRQDLAVGNIVGSNLLNLLVILGTVIMIKPLSVAEPFLRLDIPVMVVVSVALLPIAWRHQRIGRPSGIVLVSSYVVYMVIRYQGAIVS